MKNLKIFISGTQDDMELERDAVDQAVDATTLATGIRAETAVSQSQSPRAWIEQQIRECNIYIGIYSHRYGWVIPGENVSATEFEFNLAHKLGKSILVWIRNLSDEEKAKPDFDRQEIFLDRVSDFSSGYFRQMFHNSIDLKNWVSVALGETFTEIILRGTMPRQPGGLNNVPELPLHYLPRPADLAPLKAALLAAEGTRVGLTSKTLKTGLQGMGGVGKSVLAAALAREEEIIRTFSDGVIWLTLGQQPNLPARQAQLAEALGDPGRAFADTQQGRSALEKLLKPAACLLVLDDVWELEHAEAFNVMGPAGRMFLTTRNADVIRALGASTHSLDVLAEPQALALLAEWAGITPDDLPPVAHDVARKCGYLPLALAMVGALVRRNPESWDRALRRLDEADLEKIKRSFPDYPYPNLLRAIQVSVDALPQETRQRYLELAVFPDDTPIPLATLGVYWNMDADEVMEVCETLESRSLARRDEAGRLTLHDLLYDYAVRTIGDPKPLHQILLDAYGRKCPNGWSSGPNDGYFFDHLGYHLSAVGQEHALEHLLMQFPWMMARLETSGITALLGDYENIRFPEESELGVLLSALRMAAPVIRKPADLAGQIYGHLLSRRSRGIQDFLDSISPGVPWLRPVNLALRQAGDPSLGSYRPHSGQITAVTVLPDGSQVMCASLNKTITLLDLESGNEIRTFQDPQASTEIKEYANPKVVFRLGEDRPGLDGTLPSIFVTPNTNFIVCTFDDQTARVWNLDDTTVTCGFDHVTAVTTTADGKFLITAENKHLKLRDSTSGEIIQTIENVADHIYLVVAMADGDRVIIVTYEDHRHALKICNLKTGKVDRVLPAGYSDDASFVSYSSYGDADVGGRYVINTDRAINAIVLTSDDRYVVCASRDGSLKVWDLWKDEIIHTLSGHSGSVNAVALVPNTLYAVSGSSDKTLKVWNIESGQNIRTFTGHSGEIYSIAVTPDGKRAVSADKESLFVWDLRSTEAGHSFVGFQREILKQLRSTGLKRQGWDPSSRNAVPDDIRSVTLHPNGKQAILVNKVAGSDGHGSQSSNTYPREMTVSDQLKICELASGAINRIRSGVYGAIHAIALTPDGQYIISAASDKTLNASKLDGENQASAIDTHSSEINAIAVAPDGSFVVSGSADGTLKMVGFDRRIKVLSFWVHPGSISTVTITPDGKYAISGSAQGDLKLWKLTSKGEQYTFGGHSGRVNSVCLTPDGKHVITASVDTTLKIWGMEKKDELATLTGHGGSVNSVVMSPDGKHAISASDDETIKVWNLQHREVEQTLKGHLGPVHSVEVTPDGNHVISAGRVPGGSFVLAWNIEANNWIGNLMWHFDSVRAVALTKDGRTCVSASEDKTLKVWDLKQGTAIHILQGHEGKVFGVSITPDGRFVVSGSGGYEDNSIKIWSLDNGKLVKTLPGHPIPFGSVNAVALTPDGKRIVSASADNTLKVWDLENGREIFRLEGHTSFVNAVVVTPDGKHIVSASADNSLKVWGVDNGREILTMNGHTSFVNGVAVTSDGKRIVSASADKTLKIWDLEDGREIHTLHGHTSFVNAVAVMPDNKYIISASADKNLKIWDMDSGEEIANFTAEAGLLCCTAGDTSGTIITGDEDGWLYNLQLVIEQNKKGSPH